MGGVKIGLGLRDLLSGAVFSIAFFMGVLAPSAAHAVPEIEVQGNSTVISTPDTTPSISDGTDAGAVGVGNSKTLNYFVINNGTTDLTLTNPVVSGANAGDFAVIQNPVSPVTTGNQTDFALSFSPSATGLRTATVTFSNNDGDENPFTFNVQGTGTAIPASFTIISGDNQSAALNGAFATPLVVRVLDGSSNPISGVTINFTPPDQGGGPVPGATLSQTTLTTDANGDATVTATANNLAGAYQVTATLPGFSQVTFNLTNSAGTPEINVSAGATNIPDNPANDPAALSVTGFPVAVGGSGGRTYTISNTGTGLLTLGANAVSISGTDVAQFSVTQQPATSVAPGGSTTFQIIFSPDAPRVFGPVDVAIANDDGDENPYNFRIQGTGQGVEVNVTGNGQTIADDAAHAPGAGDHTDFGSADVASGTVVRTFTIENNGLGFALDLQSASAVSISGAHASDFTVTRQPSQTVHVGVPETFEVTFNPSAAGLRGPVDVTITNDDADESPYNFRLQGTGTTAPEINVSSSESGAVADGGTDAQGNEPAGVAKTVTYTVSNTGTADLTLAMATSSALTNVTVNSISAPGSTTVTAGNSTTFTVQYTPTVAGAFSFDLAFTNNDGNESPYNMTVSGTGTNADSVAPRIASITTLFVNSPTASDEIIWRILFDETVLNVTLDDFLVSGTTAPLSVRTPVTDNPGFGTLIDLRAVGGDLAGLNGTVTLSLAPGQDITDVAGNALVNPNPTGLDERVTQIINVDPDMKITGFGPAGGGGPGVELTNGQTATSVATGTDFGNQAVGIPSVRNQFSLSNTVQFSTLSTGANALTFSGPAAADFSVVGASNRTMHGLSATGFEITFTPSAAGPRNATVTLVSNDPDENPFTFNITGTGVSAPEINVVGNSQTISDGDVTPAVADHTDFGVLDITAGTVVRTFTIQNTGTSVLTLGANAASLSGANAGDFTVTTQPNTTVAPAGSTSVVVQFDPSAVGARAAVLTIANDDADESPYSFALAGGGISGGTVTIVQNITGEDVSVGFSSPTPVLNFSLTSVSGTALISMTGVPAGTHTLVADDLSPIGYGITSIACNDTDSTGDLVSRTATINLLSGEHVTCVFETIDARGPTTQMIADFLGARNTLLLSNQPGSDRRIDRLKGGTGVSGGDSFQAFGHGLRSPIPVDLAIDENSFSFATSLKRVMATGGEASLAANDTGEEGEDASPLDIWIEGRASRFIDGTSGDGSFGLLSFGVDYLVEPDLLIGFMGQLDRFKQDFTTPGSEIEGRGWMAGPYATLKLDEHLYLDVLGAWGRSDNDISPFGTYTDSFETDRWLVSSTLTGQFDVGNWDLRPSYTLQFLRERQFAYTDSLGVGIPEQSLSQGNMQLGPQIAYTYLFEDGSALRPNGGFEGVYSFGERNTFSAGSFAAETQGLTGQMNGGLDYRTPTGLALGLTGDYGGIGSSAKSFGLTINLSMPLN